MPTLYRLISLLVIIPSLAGCILTSKHPLSEPAEGVADEMVLGHWYGETPYGDHFFVEQSGTHGITVSFFERGKLSLRFEGHITSIGRTKVVNLRTPPTSDSRDVSRLTDVSCPYWLFPYEVKRGSLTVHAIPGSAWTDAVAAGHVRGNVAREERDKIRIIDTPEKIRQFMVEHPFPDGGVLTYWRAPLG